MARRQLSDYFYIIRGKWMLALRSSDLANFGEALRDRLWVFIRLLGVFSRCATCNQGKRRIDAN